MRLRVSISLLWVIAGALTCRGEFEGYLRISGVNGESLDPRHLNWIQLRGITHTLRLSSNSPAPAPAAVRVIKTLDRATPRLHLAAARREVFPEAVIDLIQPVGKQAGYYRIVLANVSVTMAELTGGAADAYAPLETVHLASTSVTWSFHELDTGPGRILLVSDNVYSGTGNTRSGDPEADFQAFLESLGYTVVRATGSGNTAQFQQPDPSFPQRQGVAGAAAAGADLIIVSRALNSFQYRAEASDWNALPLPVLLLNPFLARYPDWDWLNSDVIDQGYVTDLTFSLPDHSIVSGLNTDIYDPPGASLGRLGIRNQPNATVVATDSDGDFAIVTWPAGTEFYPNSGQFAGARRVFLAGLRYHETDTTRVPPREFVFEDYSENGKALLARAIAYALDRPPPPASWNLVLSADPLTLSLPQIQNAEPLLLFPNARIESIGAVSWSGGRLEVRLTNGVALGDSPVIETTGDGPGQINLAPIGPDQWQVRYAGTEFATLNTSAQGGATVALTFTFAADATGPAITALLQRIAFAPDPARAQPAVPPPANPGIVFTLQDGAGNTRAGSLATTLATIARLEIRPPYVIVLPETDPSDPCENFVPYFEVVAVPSFGAPVPWTQFGLTLDTAQAIEAVAFNQQIVVCQKRTSSQSNLVTRLTATDGPLRASAEFIVTPRPSALLAFLGIEGIEGEAITPGHSNWIQVLTLENDPDFGTLCLTKLVDKSSPQLSLLCANRTVIPSARLELISLQPSQVRFFEISLTGVRVHSARQSGHAREPAIKPLETVCLGFERVAWTHTTPHSRSRLPAQPHTAFWNYVTGTGDRSEIPAVFSVTGIQTDAGRVSLGWEAQKDGIYDLYASPTLAGAFSQRGQITAGANGRMTHTVPLRPGTMFFAVEERR